MSEVIEKDGFDRFAFETASEQISEFQDLEKHQSELLSDVFSGFYKPEPKLTEQRTSGHTIIEQMIETQEYRDLRAYTQLDDLTSIIATKQMREAILKAQEEAKKSEEEGKPADQDGIRRSVRKAMKKAQEEAEEIGEIVEFLQGTNQGEWNSTDLSKRMELVERFRNSRKFNKISEVFGKLKNLALGMIANNPTHGVDELHDITVGNDITRSIPAEFSKRKLAKLLWFKDFAESGLLQYDLKGVENKGKGPIVVCLDCSGSMEGEREEWSKALTLALALIAEKQNREFAIILFESSVKFSKKFDKAMSLQDKIDFISRYSNGGTNFDAPIKEACALIKNGNGLKPADIVFITDGEASFKSESEIKNAKLESGTRLVTIGIGCDVPSMRGVSDLEIEVHSLDDIEVVRSTFGKVLA